MIEVRSIPAYVFFEPILGLGTYLSGVYFFFFKIRFISFFNLFI